MATEPENENSPKNETPPRLPLRERFVWLWHPHFWLTLVIVLVLVVFFFLRHAK